MECIHCGLQIRREMSWPSGEKLWKDATPYLGAFCSAVDGYPHEPASGIADEVAAWLSTV